MRFRHAAFDAFTITLFFADADFLDFSPPLPTMLIFAMLPPRHAAEIFFA